MKDQATTTEILIAFAMGVQYELFCPGDDCDERKMPWEPNTVKSVAYETGYEFAERVRAAGTQGREQLGCAWKELKDLGILLLGGEL